MVEDFGKNGDGEKVPTVDDVLGGNKDVDDEKKGVPSVRHVVRLVFVDDDGTLIVVEKSFVDVVTEGENTESFTVVGEEAVVDEAASLFLNVEYLVRFVVDVVVKIVLDVNERGIFVVVFIVENVDKTGVAKSVDVVDSEGIVTNSVDLVGAKASVFVVMVVSFE